MTTRQLEAWAAGFIDGEGSFYLLGNKRPGSEVTRRPEVKATQVDRTPLDRLADIFGGFVRARPQRTVTGKIAHDWVLSGGHLVRDVVPRLIPFLTVKLLEAETLLDYARLMRPKGSGSYRLSSTDVEARRSAASAFDAIKLSRKAPSYGST